MKSKFRNRLLNSFLNLSFGVVAAGFSCQSAHSASQTWDGGASTSSLNDANNWTNNALPSGSGDTGTWDATVAGNLALTWTNAGFGSSTNGFNVNLAATHTGTLSLDSDTTTGSFALGTIAIANGAGAFSLGTGTGNSNVVFRGTNTLTNDDNDTAVFASDLRYASGGGSIRALTFSGGGNWQIDSVLKPNQSGASGAFTITKSGVGTLTLNANNTGNNGSSGGALVTGLQSVTIQQGTVVAGATGALGGDGSLGLGTVVTLGASGSNSASLFNSGAFTQANTITVASGNTGILTLGGSHTTGTSIYTGNVNLNSNVVLSAPTGGTVNFTTGIISGAGGVTVSGGGTVGMTGSNTYSGATQISNGTLQPSGTGAINSTSGITINGATAKYLHTSSTASTRTITQTLGSLDGTGTVGAVNVADNASNVVTNGNGGIGALTLGSLTFSGDAAATVRTVGSAGLAVTGALTTTPANGQVLLNATGTFTNGLNNLISFGSFSGAITDFTAGTFTGLNGRQTVGSLSLNGNNIAVNINGETVVWSGASDDIWQTAATGDDSGPNNWARKSAHTATNFWAGDVVEFNDTYNVGAGNVAVTQTDVFLFADANPVSTTFNNSAVNYSLLGSAIASGSLTKNGTGTVTLLNANTYTGPTTISAGKLELGNGSSDGTIASTSSVTNNGILAYNWGSNHTAAYAISGTGSVVKEGLGTLTLTGANTYSGGTTVNGGTVVAGVNGLNGGAITVNAGGTLTFTGNGQTSTSTLSGAGAILNNTANTILISGDHSGFMGTFTHNAVGNNTQFNSAASASQNASYTLTAGELIFAANGDYTVKFGELSSAAGNIRGGNTATGTTTLEVGNLGTNSTLAGNLTNGATKIIALRKVGAGSLTLTGTSNYSGATNVNAGTLAFSTTTQTLGSSAFTVADGATLSVKPAAAATTLLTTNSLTLGSAGTSNLAFDFNGLNPTVTQIATGALTVNGNVALNISNVNAIGTGTYKLIDYTSLSGSGSFPAASFNIGNRSSATIVNNVVDGSIDLNVVSDTPKWSGLDSGEWVVGTTGSNKNWKLGTAGTATDYIEGDQVLFDDSAAGTKSVTLNTASVSPTATTINTATSDYSLSSSSGFGIASGTLTKSGAGTATLTTTNTYTGATTINAGTLQLGNGTTDGTIASTSGVINNGTLAYNWADNHNAPYVISGTGNLTKQGAGTLTLTGANTYAGGSSITGGGVTLTGAGSLGTGTIAVGAAGTFTINRGFTLSNTVTGAGNIVTVSTTTVTGDLSGFAGTFTHNSNTQSVSLNAALTTSQNAAYVIASDQGSAQGMIAGGTGDYTLKLGSLSGVASSLFRGGNTATGTTTLEIGNLGTNTTFAGNINNGATKTLALTKVGSGTLTLSSTCGYTGATTISAGALNVTGSLAAGSAVTVAASGTLKGSGTVAGSINAAGTIAPGSSAGTLTTGAVLLTGALAIEVDGAIADKLVSTGVINLSGATVSSVTVLSGGFTQASYVIAEGTDITGTFASVPSGYAVNIVAGGAGKQAILTSTGSGYASWASSNAGGQTANLDFDLDGVSNGIEYFMNAAAGFTSNPQVVGGVVTWSNGGNIPASAYGTQFVVQTSSNLTSWTDVPVGSLTTNTNSTLSYTLPTGAGKIFARLVVMPN